jgi:two-component system, cell cycle response regulator DivK
MHVHRARAGALRTRVAPRFRNDGPWHTQCSWCFGAARRTVEDPASIQLVTFLLRAKGHDVCSIGEAVDVLRKLEQSVQTLVVMDLQVAGLDGLTLKRLRQQGPSARDLVIVAVTAYAMNQEEQRTLESQSGSVTELLDARALPDSVVEFLARGGRRATDDDDVS